MTPDVFLDTGIIPAFSLLPSQMDSSDARAMVLAIALQESRLRHRRQIKGPARSFVQFEPSGIEGVLRHHASKEHARNVCLLIDVPATVDGVFAAIEWNDVLCAAFARLLLYTSPMALPGLDQPQIGWNLYTDTWRPGTPHRETWDSLFARAWDAVVPGLRRGLIT